MGQNLTGQLISATYEDLVQISGSRLTDGTGSNINNLTITVSNATSSISASFASNATSASFASTSISASFATTAISASFATTASFALNVTPINTGSFVTTASISNATTTFTKGDGSTFALTVNNVQNASTASIATSASFATTAISASHALNANTAISSSFATTAISASHSLNANTATSASFATTALSASQANNSNTATSASFATTSISASQAGNANTATSASFATTAISSSQAGNANTAISSSFATNATSAATASFLPSTTNLNITSITASGASFTNLFATSASFGYIQNVTGSAVIIGDAFIILNADTPAAAFAGIQVYDTGSASTASLEWNGNTDNWIVVEETGASAMILTGLTGSKGAEAAPALNKLLKGTGNHTVANSNITDNGSLVTIASNTVITGSVNVTGSDVTLAQGSNLVTHHVKASAVNGVEILNNSSGVVSLFGAGGSLGTTFYGQINATAISASSFISSSQFVGNLTGTATNATSASFASTATSASFASTATSASFATNALSASFAPQTPAFPFTGSAQITGSLGVTGSATVSGTGIFGLAGGGVGIQVSDTINISGPGLFADQRVMDATSSFSPYTSSYELIGGVGPNSTLLLQGSDTNAGIFITKESLTITGSLRGQVNALSISSLTASLDCSTGNFFTLLLVSGSNTFVNPSNIQPGQTINLKVKQASVASGSISFASSVKQVSGSIYTASTTASREDIVTLISFDSTNLYLANVKNFN